MFSIINGGTSKGGLKNDVLLSLDFEKEMSIIFRTFLRRSLASNTRHLSLLSIRSNTQCGQTNDTAGRQLCNIDKSLLKLPKNALFTGSHSKYSKIKEDSNSEEKVSIGKRFKQMFKDYWYVLVPVHVATSVVWFGGFYVMCKSGVDVGSLLQFFGASEAYVEKLSNSNMGYAALAYGCYKLATPARYTVTVGGTTMTIKFLSDRGYLKTSKQVATNIKEKKEKIIDRSEVLRDQYIDEWVRFSKRMKEKQRKK